MSASKARATTSSEFAEIEVEVGPSSSGSSNVEVGGSLGKKDAVVGFEVEPQPAPKTSITAIKKEFRPLFTWVTMPEAHLRVDRSLG
jgi:hypothetical protein